MLSKSKRESSAYQTRREIMFNSKDRKKIVTCVQRLKTAVSPRTMHACSIA